MCKHVSFFLISLVVFSFNYFNKASRTFLQERGTGVFFPSKSKITPIKRLVNGAKESAVDIEIVLLISKRNDSDGIYEINIC